MKNCRGINCYLFKRAIHCLKKEVSFRDEINIRIRNTDFIHNFDILILAQTTVFIIQSVALQS